MSLCEEDKNIKNSKLKKKHRELHSVILVLLQVTLNIPRSRWILRGFSSPSKWCFIPISKEFPWLDYNGRQTVKWTELQSLINKLAMYLVVHISFPSAEMLLDMVMKLDDGLFLFRCLYRSWAQPANFIDGINASHLLGFHQVAGEHSACPPIPK